MKKPDRTKKPTSKRVKGAAPQPPDIALNCVYLYYYSAGALARIYEKFDPVNPIYIPGDPSNGHERKIIDLIENAANNGDSPPYYCLNETEKLLMRRESLLVFAYDQPDAYNQTGRLTFLSEYANDGTHTFFDSKFLNTTIVVGGKVTPISAVYCKNRMLHPNKKSLGYRVSEYFDIFPPFKSNMVIAGGPGTGGTNMGPPVPPPAGFIISLAPE